MYMHMFGFKKTCICESFFFLNSYRHLQGFFVLLVQYFYRKRMMQEQQGLLSNGDYIGGMLWALALDQGAWGLLP